MTQPTAEAREQLPIPDLHVAAPPSEPSAEPASTLGQTPHEPKVRPWELELLISGALVFSMLQIPGQLDAWRMSVEPRLDGAMMVAAILVWAYSKMAVYALAIGFSVHLAVRGYWVGVIGLEAVFPHGINWDNTRSGPIMRQVQQSTIPPLQTLIDRADRFASMVFGGAFALALLFLFSLVGGGTFMLAAFAIASRLFTGITATVTVMETMLVLALAPVIVAGLVDRYRGDRLDPDGRAARTIRRIGGAYNRLQSKALFVPLLLTLTSNLRGRRGARTMTVLLVAGGALFVMRDAFTDILGLHGDGYAFLPDAPGVLGVAGGFYQDRRGDGGEYASLPFIQGDMVRDPYVRLFLPYRPRRHNAVIPRRCPEVRGVVAGAGLLSPARPEGDQAGEAVLRCLASLQPVTLDGSAIAPAYRFANDPDTGVRGIVAYIPVDGMAKGGHVLTVAPVPPADPPAPGAKPQPPYSIPFWL